MKSSGVDMRKGRGRLMEAPGLDPSKPLNEQIATHLRTLILGGGIGAGARLPSQRMLARDLKVSRNTVLSVLGQLRSEGLLETRRGAGTYVAPEPTPHKVSRPPGARPADETPPILPLDVGGPALDLFPMAEWSKLQARRWRSLAPETLGEGDPAGWMPLRVAIAQRVAALRGVVCDPEQVIIVPSVQVAVDLAARTLASRGDVCWVEDPGYWRTSDALRMAGVTPAPSSVDEQGFDIARARTNIAARLAAVTPARQFPTGVVLSETRRAALIAWARKEDGWILEDDYESDFCFEGRAPAALAAAAPDRVVYMSTFSPILFPAIRITFLVAPAAQVDRFTAMRERTDRMMNTPLQMVLLDFMESGKLAAHVRRSREVYAERREVLVKLLKAKIDCDLRVPATGLHVVSLLDGVGSDIALRDAASQRGVVVSPLSAHAVLPTRAGLFLGFAPYSSEQIKRAVDGLAAAQASLR